MSTTGKRVMRFEESGTLIITATDSGHYEGTQELLNIRILKDCKQIGYCGFDYKNLKALSDKISKTRKGYGDAWGAGSMLFEITIDEEKTLIDAAKKDIEALDAKHKSEEFLATKKHTAPCAKCGTYCCGDCKKPTNPRRNPS